MATYNVYLTLHTTVEAPDQTQAEREASKLAEGVGDATQALVGEVTVEEAEV